MDARDALVIEHFWLVQSVVRKMMGRLPLTVEFDDLVGWGNLGLLDAAEKFDPDAGKLFKNYAEIRIRGAISDGLRELDFIPRSVRKKQHLIEKVQAQLRQQFGREPTDEEMRLAGVPQLALDTAKKAFGHEMLSLDTKPVTEASPDARRLHEVLPDPNWKHPTVRMTQDEQRAALLLAINTLPEREATVIRQHYFEEQPLHTSGTHLGITESRVSQIHGEALWRLRVKLRKMETAVQSHPEENTMASAGKNNWKAPKTMNSNTRAEGRRINALIREGILKEPFRGQDLTSADSKMFAMRDIPGQVSNLLQSGKIVADGSAGQQRYRAVMRDIERIPSAPYIALQTDRGGFFLPILCALRDLALSDEEATANNGVGMEFDTSIVKDAIKGAIPTPMTDAHVNAILREMTDGNTSFLNSEKGTHHFTPHAKQLLGMTNGANGMNGKQPQPPADPPLPPAPPPPHDPPALPPVPPSPPEPPAPPAPAPVVEEEDDEDFDDLGPPPRMPIVMDGVTPLISQTLFLVYWEHEDGVWALNAEAYAKKHNTTRAGYTQRMLLAEQEGAVKRKERGWYSLTMSRVPQEWVNLRAARIAEIKAARQAVRRTQQVPPPANGAAPAPTAAAPTNGVGATPVPPTDVPALTPATPTPPSDGVGEEFDPRAVAHLATVMALGIAEADANRQALSRSGILVEELPQRRPTPAPPASRAESGLDEDERAELARVLKGLNAEVSGLRSEVRELKARQGGVEQSNRELRGALKARIWQDARYVHARYIRGQPEWVVRTFLEKLTELTERPAYEQKEESD